MVVPRWLLTPVKPVCSVCNEEVSCKEVFWTSMACGHTFHESCSRRKYTFQCPAESCSIPLLRHDAYLSELNDFQLPPPIPAHLRPSLLRFWDLQHSAERKLTEKYHNYLEAKKDTSSESGSKVSAKMITAVIDFCVTLSAILHSTKLGDQHRLLTCAQLDDEQTLLENLKGSSDGQKDGKLRVLSSALPSSLKKMEDIDCPLRNFENPSNLEVPFPLLNRKWLQKNAKYRAKAGRDATIPPHLRGSLLPTQNDVVADYEDYLRTSFTDPTYPLVEPPYDDIPWGPDAFNGIKNTLDVGEIVALEGTTQEFNKYQACEAVFREAVELVTTPEVEGGRCPKPKCLSNDALLWLVGRRSRCEALPPITDVEDAWGMFEELLWSYATKGMEPKERLKCEEKRKKLGSELLRLKRDLDAVRAERKRDRHPDSKESQSLLKTEAKIKKEMSERDAELKEVKSQLLKTEQLAIVGSVLESACEGSTTAGCDDTKKAGREAHPSVLLGDVVPLYSRFADLFCDNLVCGDGVSLQKRVALLDEALVLACQTAYSAVTARPLQWRAYLGSESARVMFAVRLFWACFSGTATPLVGPSLVSRLAKDMDEAVAHSSQARRDNLYDPSIKFASSALPTLEELYKASQTTSGDPLDRLWAMLKLPPPNPACSQMDPLKGLLNRAPLTGGKAAHSGEQKDQLVLRHTIPMLFDRLYDIMCACRLSFESLLVSQFLFPGGNPHALCSLNDVPALLEDIAMLSPQERPVGLHLQDGWLDLMLKRSWVNPRGYDVHAGASGYGSCLPLATYSPPVGVRAGAGRDLNSTPHVEDSPPVDRTRPSELQTPAHAQPCSSNPGASNEHQPQDSQRAHVNRKSNLKVPEGALGSHARSARSARFSSVIDVCALTPSSSRVSRIRQGRPDLGTHDSNPSLRTIRASLFYNKGGYIDNAIDALFDNSDVEHDSAATSKQRLTIASSILGSFLRGMQGREGSDSECEDDDDALTCAVQPGLLQTGGPPLRRNLLEARDTITCALESDTSSTTKLSPPPALLGLDSSMLLQNAASGSLMNSFVKELFRQKR